VCVATAGTQTESRRRDATGYDRRRRTFITGQGVREDSASSTSPSSRSTPVVTRELLKRINHFAKLSKPKSEALQLKAAAAPGFKKKKGSPTVEDIKQEERRLKSDPRSYALNGMCTDVHVTHQIFQEIIAKMPSFSPSHILDYGCGTGGAFWSALNNFDTVTHYAGVDQNPELLAAARKLCSGFHVRTKWMQQIPVGHKHDLVIAIDALSGLNPKTRKATLQKLWASTGGIIVVAHHGKRAFDLTNEVRNFFLKKISQEERKEEMRLKDTGTAGGGESCKGRSKIIAPCPHLQQCPMQGMKFGCHFGLRMPQQDFPNNSEQQELIPSARFGQNVLGTYSFVVVSKESGSLVSSESDLPEKVGLNGEVLQGVEEIENLDGLEESVASMSTGDVDGSDELVAPSQMSTTQPKKTLELTPAGREGRLVSAPQKKGGHVIIELCTPEGSYVRATVGKSLGGAYKAAKVSNWGDAWKYETPTKGVLKTVLGGEVAGTSNRKTTKEQKSLNKSKQNKRDRRAFKEAADIIHQDDEPESQPARRRVGNMQVKGIDFSNDFIHPEDMMPGTDTSQFVGHEDPDFELAEAVKELERMKEEFGDLDDDDLDADQKPVIKEKHRLLQTPGKTKSKSKRSSFLSRRIKKRREN